MKRILLTVFQLGVTVALLFWVFHDPKQRTVMWAAVRAADIRWILLGIVTYVVVEVAAAIRWQVLLKVQRINLTFLRTAGLFLIGMFYNQFLPGGTGGDIVKSYLLLKETPDKKAGALLAVVFDRLIGLVALVCITGTLVMLRFQWLSQTPETRRLVDGLLLLLGSAVLGLAFTFVISGFKLFHLLPQKFPGREKLIEISAAYHLYARHWIATTVAFGASLVAHLATFATFLCVAHALHAMDMRQTPPASVPVVDFFAVMPIERTISALPISFGGAGWRELVLQVMLSNLCGVRPELAKLIGSLSFLIILLCSVPGGLVYLFYRPTTAAAHVRMRDMQREVVTLEHQISEGE